MKYRRFGKTDWQVSEIGYGMWGMAGWTGSDDEQSLASLQKAIDLGCNFFDTAWGYGEGTAKICWDRSSAAILTRNCIQLQKSHPRISSGPAAANSRWMIVFRPIILRSMCTAVWRIQGWTSSI